MKPTFLLIALTFLVSTAACAADAVVFSDDFENGFSPAWTRHSPEIQIVPEDPAAPGGNHVARLGQPGLSLFSPPFAPGDVAGALAHPEAFADWKDYEFSFRFRFGQVPRLDFPGGHNTISLFCISWRNNPYPDDPGECQLMWMLEWRWGGGAGTWYFQGPMSAWYGVNTWFETTEEGGPAGGKIDTAWHTFTVRVQADQTTTYLDGKLHVRGRDDHVLQGGVGLTSGWSAEASPGYLDVDDVMVKKLPTN